VRRLQTRPTSVLLLLLVDLVRERVAQRDRGEKHLNADDEVLDPGGHRPGAELFAAGTPDADRRDRPRRFQDAEKHPCEPTRLRPRV